MNTGGSVHDSSLHKVYMTNKKKYNIALDMQNLLNSPEINSLYSSPAFQKNASDEDLDAEFEVSDDDEFYDENEANDYLENVTAHELIIGNLIEASALLESINMERGSSIVLKVASLVSEAKKDSKDSKDSKNSKVKKDSKDSKDPKDPFGLKKTKKSKKEDEVEEKESKKTKKK